MPKKPNTKKRTQVKDLPKKEKKLSTGDMKKVKGGDKPNEVISLNYYTAGRK